MHYLKEWGEKKEDVQKRPHTSVQTKCLHEKGAHALAYHGIANLLPGDIHDAAYVFLKLEIFASYPDFN